MRNKLLALAAIAGAMIAPIAAQAQSEVRGEVTTGLVRSAPVAIDADGGIAADQRPAFRQYIIREHVPEFTVPERVEVGTVLPETGVNFLRRAADLRGNTLSLLGRERSHHSGRTARAAHCSGDRLGPRLSDSRVDDLIA